MNWRENEVLVKFTYIIGGGICSSAYSSTCFYKETLTVGTTTSVGISTAAKDAELKYATISAEDADLRFWYDGNNPATNTGHLLLKNNFISIEGINNLLNLKMISAGTSNVRISISYER